jgi:hypothetical protein
VTDAPTELAVTMLLCDAAQAVGGKLYMLGAGFSQIFFPNVPAPMAIAVRILVPWDRANQPFLIRIHLIDDEGNAVDLGQGPIDATAKIEVGRPPGLRKGTPLTATLALNAGPLSLPAGQYVWELDVDGTNRAREVFEVLQGQPQPQMGA